MRISDWSSDVCSSDLVGDGLELAARAPALSSRIRFRDDAQADPLGAGPVRMPSTSRMQRALHCPSAQASHAGRTRTLAVARQHAILYRYIRMRSEEHTSELQSLMRSSYAVFCLKKKTHTKYEHYSTCMYNYTQM